MSSSEEDDSEYDDISSLQEDDESEVDDSEEGAFSSSSDEEQESSEEDYSEEGSEEENGSEEDEEDSQEDGSEEEESDDSSEEEEEEIDEEGSTGEEETQETDDDEEQATDTEEKDNSEQQEKGSSEQEEETGEETDDDDDDEETGEEDSSEEERSDYDDDDDDSEEEEEGGDDDDENNDEESESSGEDQSEGAASEEESANAEPSGSDEDSDDEDESGSNEDEFEDEPEGKVGGQIVASEEQKSSDGDEESSGDDEDEDAETSDEDDEETTSSESDGEGFEDEPDILKTGSNIIADDEERGLQEDEFENDFHDEPDKPSSSREDRRFGVIAIICCICCCILILAIVLTIVLTRNGDDDIENASVDQAPAEEVIVLPAAQDTYLSGGPDAGTVFSTSEQLLVRNVGEDDVAYSLIQFDLELPEDEPSKERKLVLSLSHVESVADTEQEITVVGLPFESNFDMDQLTYNSYTSPTSGTVEGPTFVVKGTDSVVEVDVTPLVVELPASSTTRSYLRGRRGLQSNKGLLIMLESRSEAAVGSIFRSLEFPDEANRPRIIHKFLDPSATPFTSQPTTAAMPTVSPEPTQSPSSSSSPTTTTEQPTSTPSTSPRPSSVPSLSPKPSVSREPSSIPTTSLAPTITHQPTLSMQPSSCLDYVLPFLVPPLTLSLGASNNPLPEGAVTYISQTTRRVTIRITQLWSTENVVWIAPYYAVGNGSEVDCNKVRDVAPQATLEYDAVCSNGVATFSFIVNDESLVPGNDFELSEEHCQVDGDDIEGKKAFYRFEVQCNPPPKDCDGGSSTIVEPEEPAPVVPESTPAPVSPSPTPEPVSPSPTSGPISPAPTVTSEPSLSMQPSSCSELVLPFLIPEVIQFAGAAPNNPLPDGAVTYISQTTTRVTIRITQLWSAEKITWIAARYIANGCDKVRDVESQAELEYDVRCQNGVASILVIVNDESLVGGNDFFLDQSGCEVDDDDITFKKAAYLFEAQCSPPPKECEDLELE